MKEASSATASTLLTPMSVKHRIDDVITARLTQRAEQAELISPDYARLWHSILHLFSAGGKRLRPYMTVLAYQAYTTDSLDAIIPAAAAEELLHLAMLVHDDIIDRDLIRYGISNISGSFYDHYETLVADVDDRRHFADSAAVLAGDLLVSEAFLLAGEGGSSHQKADATRLLHAAVFGVVGGELLDTEAAFKKLASASPLAIAEYKTASYSFISPFLLGATLAGAPESELSLLRQCGRQLGIAYQLRDDILGVFGEVALTGKSNESDIREGKRTLLTDEFLRLATPSQKKLYSDTFGRHDISANDLHRLKKAIKDSGALSAVEAHIEHFADDARTCVAQLTLTDEYRTTFYALIERCSQRDV